SRCLIATACSALDGPVVIGIPNQVGAWRSVTTKCVVMVMANTQGEGKIVTQAPFILKKRTGLCKLGCLRQESIPHFCVPILGANRKRVVTDRRYIFSVEDKI